jgi:tetratricopeptide (TPR) repeat protein
LAYLDKLAAEAGDDRGLMYEVAAAYEKVGDIQGNPYIGPNLGQTSDAIRSYHKCLEIRQRLAATVADADATHDLRGLMAIHGRIGDVQQAASQTAAALTSYRESLNCAERAAVLRPLDDKHAMRDLSLSLGRVAAALSLTGDRAGAAATVERALNIARRLAELDPSDADVMRDLSLVLNRYADLHKSDGDLGGAIRTQRESIAIAQKLADADPNNAQLQRDLSLALMGLGEMLAGSHDFVGAIDQYGRALQTTQRLAQLDPTNAQAQKDLMLNHARIGALHANAAQTPKALEHQRIALSIAQKQASSDLNNSEAQRDVAVAHGMLGTTLLWSGLPRSIEEALEHLQQSLAVCQRLSDADTSDVVARHDLAASCDRVSEAYAGMAHVQSNDADKLAMWRKAHEFSGKALALLEPMVREGSLAPAEHGAVERLKQRVERYRARAQAIASSASTRPAATSAAAMP